MRVNETTLIIKDFHIAYLDEGMSVIFHYLLSSYLFKISGIDFILLLKKRLLRLMILAETAY